MRTITLDFEMFYDKDINLKTLSTLEYIRHSQSKVHGVAVMEGDHLPFWITARDIPAWVDRMPWSEVTLISHTVFDALVLYDLYGAEAARYIDTAALVRGIFATTIKADLKTALPALGLGKKGDELKLTKGVRDLDPGLEATLAEYAINDVRGCHAIYKLLWDHLPEVERDLLHLTVRMGAVPKLIIDPKTIDAGLVEAEEARNAILEASELSLDVLRSPLKFPQWVRENVAEPPTKLNPKGQVIPAFGAKDLEFKRFQAEHPKFRHVWKGKEAAGSNSDITRMARMSNIARMGNGTMAMLQNYYGAHTGRASGGGGVNVQNFKRGSAARKSLYAPPGYVVLVGDSSNIELRVNMWFSGEEKPLDILRNGGDLYAHVASEYFGYQVTKATHPEERFFGKTLSLGLGFGMGAKVLRTSCAIGFMGAPPIELSEVEAYQAVRTWRSSHQRVANTWQELGDMVIPMMANLKDGESVDYRCLKIEPEALLLPNGMRLQYPMLRYDEQLNSWVYGYPPKFSRISGPKLDENIVQALARIVVFDQMLIVDAMPDTTVVGSTHDEIIAICPKERADERLETMLDIMRIPPLWAPDIPLDAEGGTARNYSK